MSQPKRYAAKAEFIKDFTLKRAGQIVPLVPVEDNDGTWVSYDDYAALAAENERLRKAGDAMAESINFDDQRTWEDWGNQGKSLLRDCVIDWIIAKRGDEK